MSKRFGRNQRRRAREALAAAEQQIAAKHSRIANLESALRMDRALLELQRGQLAEADDFTREVAEMVGREAIIAGEPVTLDYKWDRRRQGDEIRFATLPSMRFSLDRVETAQISTVRTEILNLLSVDTIANMIRNQIQARVTLADGTVGYGISATALRRMTQQEIMRTIIQPMAHQLAAVLKKQQG